ncbi:MAG: hypothetical protein HKP14_00655 [Bacteroidia bacterium]|nr:hypothetical protein [Bacteroidia bacterium]
MRIISFAIIISLSLLTKGQNVFTKFQDTVLHDNFVSNQYNFPQKYNALELFIVENDQYRLKRINDNSYSISYAKLENDISSFEIRANILLVRTKNKKASGGLVLHGQSAGNGAIVFEINSKKRFKISKLFDNQLRYLSGTPKEQGWVKSSAINKKGRNEIRVVTEGGYYDLYINNKHVYTAYDNQFVEGKVGFYVNASSELLVYDVLVKKKKKGVIEQEIGGSDSSGGGSISDPSFQEVIVLFKAKIDEQQIEINNLKKENDKCRSMLNYDTTLVTKAQEYQINNQILTHKLDSTSSELRKAQKRLVYLESVKEDIEKGSNGDLVLNLTTILAELKKENKDLKQESADIKAVNAGLKKDNEVLLREIDRLKYMLNIRE